MFFLNILIIFLLSQYGITFVFCNHIIHFIHKLVESENFISENENIYWNNTNSNISEFQSQNSKNQSDKYCECHIWICDSFYQITTEIPPIFKFVILCMQIAQSNFVQNSSLDGAVLPDGSRCKKEYPDKKKCRNLKKQVKDSCQW